MSKALNPEAFPTQRPGVVRQGQPHHTILFNADDGRYFALDEIGSLVWEHCDGAHTISEIIVELSEQYEAPLSTIQMDLAELMAELCARNLLASADLFQAVPAPGETPPASAGTAPPPVAFSETTLLEKVGTLKSSGKVFFTSKSLPDGREVEKVFYDDAGKVSKTVKYHHDSGEGYSLMEIFNAEGWLILRHERGKPPQQFS